MGWNWRGWREARPWPTWRTPPPPWCSRCWRCAIRRRASRSARCRLASRPRPPTAPRARCPTTTTPRCGCRGCSSPGEFPPRALLHHLRPSVQLLPAADFQTHLTNLIFTTFIWVGVLRVTENFAEFWMHKFYGPVRATEQKGSDVLQTRNWLRVKEVNH